MFKTILVPVDGSSACEHALPWAAAIAGKDGGSVQLARTHVPPAPVMVGSELTADIGLDSAIRTMELDDLQRLTERFRAATALPVQNALLEGGIVDAIQDYATMIRADLIVVTTHGRGALARFWLGSVAEHLMRHSTVPTLLIRPNDERAADLAERPSIQRIVVPLDGSELAERMIVPAAKLAKTMHAEVSVLMVLDAVENIEALAEKRVPIPGGWFPEATAAKAEAYLQHAVHRFQGHGVVAHQKLIPHGSAAGPILEYAHGHGSSIIALATHGRGGLRRLLLGSVADKIVRGASVPVLIYHPADA